MAGRLEHVVGAAAAGEGAHLVEHAVAPVASTAWVAPNWRARASRAAPTSAAMIVPAPARRAPCSTLRPTAPQPITSTLEPGSTLALRTAAPTPVITPQPMMQARSNGISFEIAIAPDSGTTVYSACVEVVKKWCTGAPARLMRELPSSSSPLGSCRLYGSHRIGTPRSQ